MYKDHRGWDKNIFAFSGDVLEFGELPQAQVFHVSLVVVSSGYGRVTACGLTSNVFTINGRGVSYKRPGEQSIKLVKLI